VIFQLALVGVRQRVADSAREVRIGRGDHQTVAGFLAFHDSRERMLVLFARLDVPDQV
jgi:primosomal replication protein N